MKSVNRILDYITKAFQGLLPIKNIIRKIFLCSCYFFVSKICQHVSGLSQQGGGRTLRLFTGAEECLFLVFLLENIVPFKGQVQCLSILK